MSLSIPDYLTRMSAVEDLAEFEAAASDAAAQLLEGRPLLSSGFIALHGSGAPRGFYIDAGSLENSRFCRPREFSAGLAAALAAPGERHVFPPGEFLVDGEPPCIDAACIVFPLREGERLLGAWLVAADGDPAVAAAQLLPLANCLALVFGHVLRNHMAREQNRQTVELHETMLKLLAAANHDELLDQILNLLLRQYGMERVSIAMVNPATQVPRSELHTGFPPEVLPFSAGNNGEFFAWTARQGETMIFDRSFGPIPPGLPARDDGSPPERAILTPLRIGSRSLGMIYADQPRHDGRPIFVQVIDLLGRSAGAALENMRLRSDAELRAETDPLTGLRNRHFLDRVLEMEIPRVKRYNQPISLLMIDLLEFKSTNDAYGHVFGDFVLRETANLLQANVRRPDFVIRFGGDEFLVLMVNTDEAKARLVSDRIERAFVERNRLQSDEKTVIRVSIGLRAADSTNIDELINDADMAMYAQKARQKRRQLVDALLVGNLERIEAADKVVGSLSNMLHRKAPHAAERARRVAHLAMLMGRRLSLSAEELETLALAALLHDVGKVSLPNEILRKTRPLTASEKEAVRQHPGLGEEFFVGIDHLEPLRPLIRSHHERYDGRTHGERPGYPDGLAGEQIPLGARILKLADSLEAMLYDRPYRAAMSADEAVAAIKQDSGKAFDPRLVAMLIDDPRWREGLGEVEAVRALVEPEN